MDEARALVARYYAAFNAGDVAGMLDCLAEDIAHHVNEGAVRVGKPAFEAFCRHMNECYREHLGDIVVMASPDGPGRRRSSR
jgi:ketosteroid isomerase-like protein